MVVWKTKYEVRNWGRREEEGLPWLGGLRVGGLGHPGEPAHWRADGGV